MQTLVALIPSTSISEQCVLFKRGPFIITPPDFYMQLMFEGNNIHTTWDLISISTTTVHALMSFDVDIFSPFILTCVSKSANYLNPAQLGGNIMGIICLWEWHLATQLTYKEFSLARSAPKHPKKFPSLSLSHSLNA